MKRGAAIQQMGVTLDPIRKGSEPKSLEVEPRALVVGQDEAIDQIVNLLEEVQLSLLTIEFATDTKQGTARPWRRRCNSAAPPSE